MFSKKSNESVDVLQKIREEITKDKKIEEKIVEEGNNVANQQVLSGEDEDFLSDVDGYFDSFSSEKTNDFDVNVVEKNNNIDDKNEKNNQHFEDINKVVSGKIDKTVSDQENFEKDIIDDDFDETDGAGDTNIDVGGDDGEDGNKEDAWAGENDSENGGDSFSFDLDSKKYNNDINTSSTDEFSNGEKNLLSNDGNDENQKGNSKLDELKRSFNNNVTENGFNDSVENDGMFLEEDGNRDAKNNIKYDYDEDSVFDDFKIENYDLKRTNDNADDISSRDNNISFSTDKDIQISDNVDHNNGGPIRGSSCGSGNDISEKTKNGVKGSITELIENVKNQMLSKKNANSVGVSAEGSKTIEQFVMDLLQPKIVEFLDNNLERIVKGIVNKEIQKIVDDVNDSE